MNNNYWLQRLFNGTSTPSDSPFNVDYNPDATPQQLDSFLANAMAQLNVQQRESALEDLHGIRNSENPERDPATVDLWLQMLDRHIENIKRGTIYEMAEAMDRSYVTSRSFRMMYLRANRYDPEAAANQVIRHLELKRLLFGQEKPENLTKKITLADLSHEDREFLASGAVQVSRQRDRSGREILLFFPSLQTKDTPVEVILRARYYTIMSMIESEEENQRNGIIFVYFGALPSQPNQHSKNAGLLWDLPIHFSGFHLCFDQLSAYVLASVAILRVPLHLRPRVRVHYGSCTDCLYKLSSFGIARHAILTDNNEPRFVDHSAWCRRRQDMELTYVTDSDADTQSVESTDCAIVPRPVDVLFGPGSSRQNGGNILMKNLILGMLDEHSQSKKGRKMQLTKSVVEEIKKTGGRFLKQNEETKEWEEASHTEACRKIAHTFRNIRRPCRGKKKV